MNFLTKLNSKKITQVFLLITVLFLLSGCVSQESYLQPADEGGIFSKIFVFPIAWVLFHITEIFGGSLTIGIILTTILIRTLAWPIYAKGASSMAAQQEIQPEIQKIQAKYAGKNDTASQQKMSAEIRQVYKDNNTSMLGCITPLLQMPIFLAVYSAIRRFPNNIVDGTKVVEFAGKTQEINHEIAGIDILENVSTSFNNEIYVAVIIPLLVAVSMFFVQRASQQRSKKLQQDIPEYKRNKQAESMAKSTQFLMYGTIVMMVWFTYSSPALLGIYWTIGNFYSLIQTHISNAQRDKKRAKR